MKNALLFCLLLALATGCRSLIFRPAHPLNDAAYRGDLTEVKRLLDKGRDVDEQDSHGCTPLVYAAASGNIQVVKVLLGMGANVNGSGTKCASALETALTNGNKEIADLLRQHGAQE